MVALGADRSFGSLSVRDLLVARETYHWHLINKANVVGTAVGLYRIRTDDPWPDRTRSALAARRVRQVKPARTFDNSEVRDYSWPCVLVLVDEWTDADRFGLSAGQVSPDELVPKTLYLQDGRTVPVCVVEVDRVEADATPLPPRTWPDARLGGGFPLVSTVRHAQHLASVGALVTDGHTTYALTSRHVSGPAGEVVSSVLRGRTVAVGRSAGRHLTRLPFTAVYPELPGYRTSLTLDAGLIEVDDVTAWTSRTYGLPALGELADLNELNITLSLIGARVRAFGAATGSMSGSIAALFYRYRSLGGYDQVTDFLIAPALKPGRGKRRGAVNETASRPGDSGTIWHLEQTTGELDNGADANRAADGDGGGAAPVVLRPIAIQWGGQALGAQAAGGFNFALATNLSAVMRLLDVDLVTAHNVGAAPFWGKTGHYAIATFACQQVTGAKLRKLMNDNVDRISFAVDELGHTTIDKTTIAAKESGAFMPLADVPDLIWKNQPKIIKGGRDTSFNVGPEHPCHFADIDYPWRDGNTLRALCVADPGTFLNPAMWQQYYEETAAARKGSTNLDASRTPAHPKKTTRARAGKASDETDNGLLPFRVWQFFDTMTAAVKDRDITRFLAAAGLVAHYVGDACQPLHGSWLSDGIVGGKQGVHSTYESVMVDRHDTDITSALPAAIDQATVPAVTSGAEAAAAVVALMDRAAHRIDPAKLGAAYDSVAKKDDDSSPPVTDALWDQYGVPTIDNIADGLVTLAGIWSAAWKTGAGETKIAAKAITPIDTDALQALYQDPTFVPSLNLEHVQSVLFNN